MPGLSALAATAMPAIRPPPPTATTSVSSSGTACSISMPDGALAGDDGLVVVGMDEDQLLLLGQLQRVAARLVQRVAVQHDFGAEAAGALHLHPGREARHHDHRAQAQPLRVVGHALRVVARAHGDHAARAVPHR